METIFSILARFVIGVMLLSFLCALPFSAICASHSKESCQFSNCHDLHPSQATIDFAEKALPIFCWPISIGILLCVPFCADGKTEKATCGCCGSSHIVVK